MSIEMIVFLSVLPAIIAVLIALYICGFRHIGKEERCTMHVKGKIIRYSAVQYSGINIPLVEYWINDKRYKITGPKFTSVVVTRVSSPRRAIKAVSKSNLTTREMLPKKLRMTIYSNSMVNMEGMHLADLYPVHSEVDVYCNPNKPKEAFVQRCEGINSMLVITFASLLVILIALIPLSTWLVG